MGRRHSPVLRQQTLDWEALSPAHVLKRMFYCHFPGTLGAVASIAAAVMLLGGGGWTREGFSDLLALETSCLPAEKLGSVTAVPGRPLWVGWPCDLRDLFVYSALVSV